MINEPDSIAVATPKYRLVSPLGTIKRGTIRQMEANLIQWDGNSEPLLDIRWWLVYEGGRRVPGRGGIRLELDEAKTLLELLKAAKDRGEI